MSYRASLPAVIFTHPGAKYLACADTEKMYWSYPLECATFFRSFCNDHSCVLKHVEFSSGMSNAVAEIFRLSENGVSDDLPEQISLKCLEFILEYRKVLRFGTTGRGVGMTTVNKAAVYLSTHFREPADIAHLAKWNGMSYRNFLRTFLRELGMSPSEYLQNIRLNEAKRLLCETDLKIYQIAELSGFPDVCHFSRQFRKMIGVPPSHFRKN